ncbi:MAG: hypothetical protein ACK5NK_12435 [Niabella sp.]
MKNRNQLFVFFLIFGCMLFVGCGNGNRHPAENVQVLLMQEDTVLKQSEYMAGSVADSTSLLQLTKKLYEWEEASGYIGDFSPLQHEKTDTIYAGLNMAQHQQRMQELKATGFFSESFLNNYNKIAVTINNGMTAGTIRWNVGELPPFGNGANPWCNCQDVPDRFLDKIRIRNLTFKKDTAAYRWSWGNGGGGLIKAIRENDEWTILYLDGFNFDSFLSAIQYASSFAGTWENNMVYMNVGDSSLVFFYHGQCAYEYPVHKLSNTEFELIWSNDMDCKFDNGVREKFGLKNTPVIGKPFAKFTLRNHVLYADYYYKEWVAAYAKQIQEDVFTPEYHWKTYVY